jgi:hypothetical protein
MVLLNDVIQGSGADGHPDLWGFGDGQKAFFSLKQGKPDPAIPTGAVPAHAARTGWGHALKIASVASC